MSREPASALGTRPIRSFPESNRVLVAALGSSLGAWPSELGSMLPRLAPVLVEPQALCDAVRHLLGAEGVAISLSSGGLLRMRVADSGFSARSLERVQMDTGEGPGPLCCVAQRPVLESDLEGSEDRWPAFVAEARALDVGAAFSFPLGPAYVGLGALTLYRAARAPLSPEEEALVSAATEWATTRILSTQIGRGSPDLEESDQPDAAVPAGLLPGAHPVTGAGSGPDDFLDAATSGIVAWQIGCTPSEAMGRLRDHARIGSCSISAVAEDLRSRRLRFLPIRLRPPGRTTPDR